MSAPRNHAQLAAIGLLVLLYAGSRIPFLGLGYGSDDDGWLVAKSADRLAAEHVYRTSRLPGYPVPELAYAGFFAVFGTRFRVGNALSATVGLLAVLAFFQIARRVLASGALLCATAFMFHPGFWIASTSTHDIVWSVCFLVAAFLAGITGRLPAAGMAMGLAVGARITNVVFLAPLLLSFLQRGAALRDHVRFGTWFLLSSAACLAPLWFAYGSSFLDYSPPRSVDHVTGAYKAYAEVFGAPFVAIAVLYLIHRFGARRARRATNPPSAGRLRDDRAVLVGAILVLSLPFVMLPIEALYLLPAAAFLILLVGRVSSAAYRRAMLVALMLNAFVGIGRLDVGAWRENHQLRLVPFARGGFFADVAYRRRMLDRASRLARTPLPSGAAILVGPSFFALLQRMGVPEREFSHGFLRGDTRLYRVITLEELEELRGRLPLYYVEGENLPYLMRRVYGYSLLDAGAKPLVIEERSSSL